MGIIDSKTRFIDTFLTQEGRRQLAEGKFIVEFVTFTDADTFYEKDAVSGSSDGTMRLFFEACDMSHDQLTFEADDAGRLKPFRGSDLGVIDGKVLSSSNSAYLSVVTGSAFTSVGQTLLSSSIDNFNKLYVIRTNDAFFDDEREFETSVDKVKFTVADHAPLKRDDVRSTTIDHVESLFQDKRLSSTPNFRYLPPVNSSVTGDGIRSPLGVYPIIGQRKTPYTFQQLKTELATRERASVEFSVASARNNVVCQMFELKSDVLTKLDVIDFGETNDGGVLKRVFFVGKVFIDGHGLQTFVNMFTLIFGGV